MTSKLLVAAGCVALLHAMAALAQQGTPAAVEKFSDEQDNAR